MSFEQPNYTQAPNAFFDDLLPEIDTVTELKVTLAVMRKTMGFHRKEHEMSLSYLEKATGLSRPAVVDGLKRAMKRGTLTRRKVGQSYKYRLNVVSNSNQSEKPTSKQTEPEVVNDVNQQLVNKSNPRKKGRKKEKESIPVGTAEPSQQTNYFELFARTATDLGYEVTPEDRKELPGNLKKVAAHHDDMFMRRVVRRCLAARADRQYPLSPQKARDELLGDKKPVKQTSDASQFRGGNEHASVDEERKQRIRRQMGMAS